MAKLTLAHKLSLGVLSLVVFIFLAGFIYIYIGDNGGLGSALPAAYSQSQYKPLPKPAAPSAATPVGTSVEALDSPVTPGSTTSLIIDTKAYAYCNITVKYNNVVSHDPALGTKQADAYGTLTWTWTIPPNAPLGNWPISVTCHDRTHASVVDDQIQILQ